MMSRTIVQIETMMFALMLPSFVNVAKTAAGE